MPDENFSIGDPVWAKLKGFCPWPGKVTRAPEGLKQPATKKKTICVYFFRTENYAFIEPQFIKPFAEYRAKFCSANKSNQFKEALAEIDQYISQRGSAGVKTEDDGKSKYAPFKPAKNSETPSKPAKNSDTPSKPAKNSETPSKPAKNSDTPSKPAKNSDTPSKPAKNSDTSSKPAKNSDTPSKPAKNSETPSKPSKNSETQSKPAKNSESPSKPAKSNETLSKKRSQSTSAENKTKKPSVGQSAKKSAKKQTDLAPVNGTPAKRARKSKPAENHTEDSNASKRRRVGSSSSCGSSAASVADRPSPEFTAMSAPRASGSVAESSPVLHTDGSGLRLPGLSSPSASTKRVASLLDRPAILRRPSTPPLDMDHISSTLKEKNIQPSEMRIGLLGLGTMGSRMARNLLNSGHQMSVWNRSSEKCDEFVKAGAEMCITPSDVVGTTDVTLLCVSDPHVSKEIIFGNCGVLQEINTTKGYVEMTTVDSDTSQDVADAIAAKGGRYLEAQVQGSREEAQEGSLVILCAGDRSLFDDCQSCFQAIAKNAFYFGEVGNASRLNLVLQLLRGVQLTALAEAMALADRAGIKLADVLDVLTLTSQACPLLLQKGKAIIEGSFTTQMALKYMQKDLRLCMAMSDQLEQPLPLTAAANETFKQAKRVGYGDHDVSAVYIRARF